MPGGCTATQPTVRVRRSQMLRRGAAERHLPTVALIDHRMSGMDAVALAHAIRRDPITAGTRLVLLDYDDPGTTGNRGSTSSRIRGIPHQAGSTIGTATIVWSRLSNPALPLATRAWLLPRRTANHSDLARPSTASRRGQRGEPAGRLGLLEPLGHRVDIVSNGAEAVAAAAAPRTT